MRRILGTKQGFQSSSLGGGDLLKTSRVLVLIPFLK